MVVPSAAIASAAAIREGNKRGKAKLDAAAAEGDHAVSTDVEGGQPKRPKSLIRQTTGKMLAYDVREPVAALLAEGPVRARLAGIPALDGVGVLA